MQFSIETLWQALSFLAGILITAIINTIISRRSERARPSARISNITIAPTIESRETPIDIGFELYTRIATNAVLPGLNSPITVRTLKEFLSNAQIFLKANQTVMDFLRDLNTRRPLLGHSMDKEERRKAILFEWAKFAQPLETLAISTIQTFIDDKIFKEPVYRSHPQEWKDPARANVALTGPGFSGYNLSEIDVERELEQRLKGERVITIDTFRRVLEDTNIMRRFWINLEEDHLRWLFSKMIYLGEFYELDAKNIVEKISELIKLNTPDYLRVQILITNNGGRAVAIRPFTYLRIPLAEADEATQVLVPLILEGIIEDRASVEVIKENDAIQFTFRSEQPLSSLKIIDKSNNIILDETRLRAMFNGRILKCQVALSLTGFESNHDEVIVSNFYDFGAPADSRVRKKLAEKLNQLN